MLHSVVFIGVGSSSILGRVGSQRGQLKYLGEGRQMYRHVCVHIHMYAHMHVLNVHTPMHAQGKVLQSNKLGIKKSEQKKQI